MFYGDLDRHVHPVEVNALFPKRFPEDVRVVHGLAVRA